jgi:hypothetical protein
MIVLHIGPHKTGSTSIQGFMAQHEPALAAQGVLYPDIGRTRAGGHYGLKAEIRDRDSALPGWLALAELDRRNPEARIVVSCEGFEYLSDHQVAAVAHALRGRGVLVIGYFRDYGGLIQSQYLQLSRICRNVSDFDSFFDTYLSNHERVFLRFERWAQAFGWAQVRLRLFDRSLLVGGDVVEDFLREIGCSRAALKIEAGGQRNLAPPWEAVEIMRAVFQEFGRLGELENPDLLQVMRRQVRQACEAVMADPTTPLRKVEYLSAAQRERCNALNQQDLADFSRCLPAAPALALPTPEPRERPFLPSVAQVDGTDVARAMARVTMALLQAQGDDKLTRKLQKKAERAAQRQAAEEGPTRLPARQRKTRKLAASMAPLAG